MRKRLRRVSWALTVVAAATCGVSATPAHAQSDGLVGTTVVSLTFDDGRVSQIRDAWPILAVHGTVATFYVNTGTLGLTGRMSWADISTLAAGGNEIGGHSTYHANLLVTEPDEAA